MKTELDKLSVSVSEQEQVDSVRLYCLSYTHSESFRNRLCLMHAWSMSVRCPKVFIATVPVCFILFSVACMKHNTVQLELDIALCDL